MKNYMLSIIIPVYNVEKYIKQCLDSIFKQNLEYVEVIIVDDRGNDGSMDIVNSYKKDNENSHHMRIIRHIKNKGLSEARNTGIRNSKGKYITFLDSDDYIVPDSLSLIVKWLCKNEIDMVELNYKEINVSGLDIELKKNKSKKQYINKMTGEEYFIYMNQMDMYVPIVCSKVYRRNYLLEHRLFVPNLNFEDEEFMPRILIAAKSVCKLDVDFYVYRRRLDSISTSYEKNEKWIDCYVYIIKSLLLLSNKTSNMECKKILYNRAGNLVLSLLKNQCRYCKSKNQWKKTTVLLKKKKLYQIPMKSNMSKIKMQGILLKNPVLFRALYIMYIKIQYNHKKKEKQL